MEIFRQIDDRFERLEKAQSAVVATCDNLQSQMAAVQGQMSILRAQNATVLQEMSAIRGCFASVEAMLITNAAQLQKHSEELTDVKKRLEILERRAS